LLFSFLVSALVWIGWIADWLSNRSALSIDIDGTSALIACTSSVAWVLMALQGAVSYSHEREHSTLDALLTTPLSAAQILWGKLQGIIRSSAFALVFPIIFTVVAWIHGVTTGRAASQTIFCILAAALFAACLGLASSVWLGSSGKACGFAAGIVLILCVGVPLATEAFVGFQAKLHSHKVTFISPSLNVAWTVCDERKSRQYGYGPYPNWDERFAVSTGHLLFELITAGLLLGWSMHRVESHFRVRSHSRFYAQRIPLLVSPPDPKIASALSKR
jgi:hypothetical protein